MKIERPAQNRPLALVHYSDTKTDPMTEGADLSDSDHLMQLYEDGCFPDESVAEFIMGGLRSGATAMVIATEPNRALITGRLADHGLNPGALAAEGRLLLLDAQETLAGLLRDGMPDAHLFGTTIGEFIGKATADGGKLHVFGEMVAMLLAEERGQAALDLEKLWNEVAEQHDFALFSAYPLGGFSKAASVPLFEHICQEHTRVVPTESFIASTPSRERQLRAVALLQQRAAALEHEIAERKRAEGALVEAAAELGRSRDELELRVQERTASLREAISQMEEFSYTVSHDLQAPLRAISVHCHVLLDDFREMLEAEPDAMNSVRRISDNCSRMDRMLRDVLAYGRVARNELNLQPVSLDHLVAEMISHHPALQPPRAMFDVEPLGDIIGHEPSLIQILSNMLSNAVKFVAPGVTPEIRLWAEPKGDRLRLWIEDNGIGIDPQYHERLFTMFERIHPKLPYEGTGVGLAIVRKATERMGGSVGVESDGTSGSRFWVELPRV